MIKYENEQLVIFLNWMRLFSEILQFFINRTRENVDKNTSNYLDSIHYYVGVKRISS